MGYTYLMTRKAVFDSDGNPARFRRANACSTRNFNNESKSKFDSCSYDRVNIRTRYVLFELYTPLPIKLPIWSVTETRSPDWGFPSNVLMAPPYTNGFPSWNSRALPLSSMTIFVSDLLLLVMVLIFVLDLVSLLLDDDDDLTDNGWILNFVNPHDLKEEIKSLDENRNIKEISSIG